MTGPFGGYGGYVTPERDQRSYHIDASVKGQPAAGIKLIVYMPGCEIVTLAVQLSSGAVSRELSCKHLRSLPFQGQIFPNTLTQEKPSEVTVSYLAEWSHRFFGIVDGPITTIRLGTAVPDSAGRFEIHVPDFHAQKSLGEGEFGLILREAGTGNIIAFLRPSGPKSVGVKIADSYPTPLQLIAERQ